jgi:hypothetical protein
MRMQKEWMASLAVMVVLAGCGGSDGGDVRSGSTGESGDTSSVTPRKPVVAETAPSNWYIRVTAEDPARGMKTQSTQLGQLEESDTVRKHTLKALTPFGSSYLDIIFRDPAGVGTGDYKVSFHQYAEDSEDNWTFTVRTDDANADILLSWRGLYVLTPYIDDQNRKRYREYRSVTNPLIRQMKLVDVESGKEIAAAVDGKAQTYAFNMNGQTERTFQWVVETEEVSIPVQISQMATMEARAVKKDAVMRSPAVRESKRVERFDITRPPMIKEDMYGK